MKQSLVLSIFLLVLFFSCKKLKEGNSVSNSDVLKQELKNDTNSSKLGHPKFLVENKRTLYVGATRKDETQFIYGLEFTALDSMNIKYKIDFLKDWKMEKVIEGIATIDTTTVLDNWFKIQHRNGESLPAYNFLDNGRKCSLQIRISKSKYLNGTIAQVQENCGEIWNDLTPIMYYK